MPVEEQLLIHNMDKRRPQPPPDWSFLVAKKKWLPKEYGQVLHRMVERGPVNVRPFLSQRYGVVVDDTLLIRAVARLEFRWKFGNITPIRDKMAANDLNKDFFIAIDRLRYGDSLEEGDSAKLANLESRGMLRWCGPQSGIVSVRLAVRRACKQDQETRALKMLDACISVGLSHEYFSAWRTASAREQKREREEEDDTEANHFFWWIQTNCPRSQTIQSLLNAHCPELVENFDLWAAQTFFVPKEKRHLLADPRCIGWINYDKNLAGRKAEFLQDKVVTENAWLKKASRARKLWRVFALACFAHQDAFILSNSGCRPFNLLGAERANKLMEIARLPLPQLQQKWNCTRQSAIEQIVDAITVFMEYQYWDHELITVVADNLVLSDEMEIKLRQFLGIHVAEPNCEKEYPDEC